MASPITDNPIIVDISTSYGCILVGNYLSAMAWAISTVQLVFYMSNERGTDTLRRKLFVLFLYVCDTVNEILVLQSIWPVLIKHYGSIAGLAVISPELIHHSWITGIVAFCVQLFFIQRIWAVSGKKWLFPIFLFVMSIFQLAVLIPYDIIAYSRGPELAELYAHKLTSMGIALRAVSAAEDIMISAAMIYLVLSHGMPEYRNTKLMLYRLIFVTVNTGFWTAVAAVLELALVARYPNTLQFFVFDGPLCSLYLNSLLGSLNARDFVVGTKTTVLEWNEAPSHMLASSTVTSGSRQIVLQPFTRSQHTTMKSDTPTNVEVQQMQTSAVDFKVDRDVHQDVV